MRGRRTNRFQRKLWDEDFEAIRLTKSKKRSLIIRTVLFFFFFVIVVRLIFLMILDHEKLSQKADRQYLNIKTLNAQRGEIWDRGIRPLAINIETDSLYAVPSRIAETKTLSAELARVINVSAEKINEELQAKRDRDFIWIKRRLDKDITEKINELKDYLKIKDEIGFRTEVKRYYPNGYIGAHIVGYTNVDNKGVNGLELKYNNYLEGKEKKIYLDRDARGNGLSTGIEDNIPGDSLVLTIDANIQNIVEREIENAMVVWQAGAVVAIMMNPVTGEIIAMANRPNYDPNFAGASGSDKWRNRAITDMYEPGSTFKTITASAALEERVVKPWEKFDVSRSVMKVPGGVIRDVHRHGVLTFKEVIQKSSNIGIAQIGFRLGKERFYKYIKGFGFGEKTGIDLPGEVKGFVRGTGKWSGRSLASVSFGQEIAVTPLQILRAYSAIANGGKIMKPYVVSEIISPAGEVIKSFSPEVEARVISEDTARIMRDILKTVVEEGGTAQKASIMGNLVAGKTGTAQMVDPRTGYYSRNDYVSSFVGFVPADDPKIALIVVVYKPRGATYGGVVAAPVFKNIIEHTLVYLNVPMENEQNNITLISSN